MEVNELRPLFGFDFAIGTALAALQDARQRTLDAVAGLAQDHVDASAHGYPNSIGATLYHIAAIEADWLYADILEEEYPDWMGEWFPHDVREEGGTLSPAPGFSPENHLARLAEVRRHFINDIARLDPSAFNAANGVDDNPSTPQWAIHHLSQHEAEHRGQIQVVRTFLEG